MNVRVTLYIFPGRTVEELPSLPWCQHCGPIWNIEFRDEQDKIVLTELWRSIFKTCEKHKQWLQQHTYVYRGLEPGHFY